MAYGLSTRLFIEDGPELTARRAQQRSSTAAHNLLWQQMRPDQRLRVIDQVLDQAA